MGPNPPRHHHPPPPRGEKKLLHPLPSSLSRGGNSPSSPSSLRGANNPPITLLPILGQPPCSQGAKGPVSPGGRWAQARGGPARQPAAWGGGRVRQTARRRAGAGRAAPHSPRGRGPVPRGPPPLAQGAEAAGWRAESPARAADPGWAGGRRGAAGVERLPAGRAGWAPRGAPRRLVGAGPGLLSGAVCPGGGLVAGSPQVPVPAPAPQRLQAWLQGAAGSPAPPQHPPPHYCQPLGPQHLWGHMEKLQHLQGMGQSTGLPRLHLLQAHEHNPPHPASPTATSYQPPERTRGQVPPHPMRPTATSRNPQHEAMATSHWVPPHPARSMITSYHIPPPTVRTPGHVPLGPTASHLAPQPQGAPWGQEPPQHHCCGHPRVGSVPG